jgi:hypothetical protein
VVRARRWSRGWETEREMWARVRTGRAEEGRLANIRANPHGASPLEGHSNPAAPSRFELE